ASTPQALRFFSDSFYFVRSQLVSLCLGLVALVVCSKIHYRLWQKLSVVFLMAMVAMLLLVLLPGVGLQSLGARRWIDLGFTTFQPAEFVKLFFAIYVSSLVGSNKHLLSFIFPMAAVAILVMLQPDMGTTLVIMGIGLSAIFINGFGLLKLAVLSLTMAAGGLVLVLTSGYRKARLMSFLNTSQDPLTSSYHVKQILLGLGLGGLFGSGLGQSRQKFLFLPESATDSVFVVIAEELGFIGASVVILLLGLLVYRIFKVALRTSDRFASALVTCIGVWLGLQTFLNIGSMVVLVPLTGIPLPFFSYGGTSLIAILASLGIVLNVSKERQK
ncbi:MAG: cell division membrane protein, partial [uncultured bacterium]